MEGLTTGRKLSHNQREQRISVDKNKCLSGVGVGGRKLGGLLPDSFYFHQSSRSEVIRVRERGEVEKGSRQERADQPWGGEGWAG